MRPLKKTFFLLAMLVLASSAFTQTMDRQAGADLEPDSDSSRITTARCRYTPGEESCAATDNSAHNTADRATLAQAPQRRPGPPFRPRTMPSRYPRPRYSQTWVQPETGRGAAIGALIGGGLGMAAGLAAKPDSSTKGGAVLIGGGLGALFGAAVGAAVSALHNRPSYSQPWPPDDPEDDELGARSKPGSNGESRQQTTTNSTPLQEPAISSKLRPDFVTRGSKAAAAAADSW